MRILSIVTIVLLLQTIAALAQPVSEFGEQETAGRRILEAIVQGRDSAAWMMTSPELREKVPFEWLMQVATQIRKMGAVGGFAPEFLQLAMRATPDQMGKPSGFERIYTFKADSTYPPRFTISVSFIDPSSTVVTGVTLNDLMMGPSYYRPGAVRMTAREHEITGQEGWLVAGDSVAIDGVTLVLLPENEVLMVIKIFQDMPPDADVKSRAVAAGLPVVRYALEHGYRQKATDYLLAFPDLKLMENVGLAFITPGTTRFYRTMVTPEQYNAK